LRHYFIHIVIAVIVSAEKYRIHESQRCHLREVTFESKEYLQSAGTFAGYGMNPFIMEISSNAKSCFFPLSLPKFSQAYRDIDIFAAPHCPRISYQWSYIIMIVIREPYTDTNVLKSSGKLAKIFFIICRGTKRSTTGMTQ